MAHFDAINIDSLFIWGTPVLREKECNLILQQQL